MKRTLVFLTLLISACGSPAAKWPDPATTAGGELEESTNVYFGDTHLHTSASVDAYLLGNKTASPDVAYRWAKGYPVVHPYHRARVRIGTPLDFLVVADHAEMMGVPVRLFGGDEQLAQTETGREFLRMVADGQGGEVNNRFLMAVGTNQPFADLNTEAISRAGWQVTVDAAERHNDPGNFTALIGWEWSSTPRGANWHRVVFQAEGGDVAQQYLPYSSFDSQKPEDLWSWLGETSERTGASFVSIPHNPNLSMGGMFATVDSDGRPITADYARTRMLWEPIVEITQMKGDSETMRSLSPTDEFAEFETFVVPGMAAAFGGDAESAREIDTRANYVRSGLLRGLEFEASLGVNPYKFGFIGSTDSHNATSSAEEDNYQGKFAPDSIPENTWAAAEGAMGMQASQMAAAGMAAVWAPENTRQAIYDAFRRREVYATTGPRIRLRLFGGWDFTDEDAAATDMAERGYQRGVPMGGDLTAGPEGAAPSFMVYAIKDPVGANLDRVQIVKGWLDASGEPQERVFDVVWGDADSRQPSGNGRLPAVGNTVEVETATWTNTIGDAMLATRWTDPEFDASQRAVYYVRVLQIPTPRHTTYDAVALQRELPEDVEPYIQERAYSSPIWYTP